jgi:hypothetical protein
VRSGGFSESPGFGDGCGGEFSSSVRAVLDEGVHGLSEVGAEIEAVALAVSDEGVGDAAEFASSPGTKEHVVFGSNLQAHIPHLTGTLS